MLENRRTAPRTVNPPRFMKNEHCGRDDSARGGIKQQKKIIDIPRGDTMSALAIQHEAPAHHFNQDQIDILKNSICKGVSNDEFQMFLMACTKTKLDPFMKQIYAIPRKFKKPDGTWGNSVTIQTSIDGYRLIAERTGRYAPGCEPTFTYDKNNHLESATAYIKKLTKDGTWHTVSASAHYDEYCQSFTDKSTGEKKPSGLWQNMPRTMLAKCAEAQALRKAFPAEMSGLYTKDEMMQADTIEVETPKISHKKEQAIVKALDAQKITAHQVAELEEILSKCSADYGVWLKERMSTGYGIDSIENLTVDIYEKMKIAAIKNITSEQALATVDEEYVKEYSPEENA